MKEFKIIKGLVNSKNIAVDNSHHYILINTDYMNIVKFDFSSPWYASLHDGTHYYLTETSKEKYLVLLYKWCQWWIND